MAKLDDLHPLGVRTDGLRPEIVELDRLYTQKVNNSLNYYFIPLEVKENKVSGIEFATLLAQEVIKINTVVIDFIKDSEFVEYSKFYIDDENRSMKILISDLFGLEYLDSKIW